MGNKIIFEGRRESIHHMCRDLGCALTLAHIRVVVKNFLDLDSQSRNIKKEIQTISSVKIGIMAYWTDTKKEEFKKLRLVQKYFV